MVNKITRFIFLLFATFTAINFLVFSGLFDRDTAQDTVNKYFYALKTMQDHLAVRMVEGFDWESMRGISQNNIYRLYEKYMLLRNAHGLIKEFKIEKIFPAGAFVCAQVNIVWQDGSLARDLVLLSKRTGKWKISSAKIYYK